jgi:hypothetical protein
VKIGRRCKSLMLCRLGSGSPYWTIFDPGSSVVPPEFESVPTVCVPAALPLRVHDREVVLPAPAIRRVLPFASNDETVLLKLPMNRREKRNRST